MIDFAPPTAGVRIETGNSMPMDFSAPPPQPKRAMAGPQKNERTGLDESATDALTDMLGSMEGAPEATPKAIAEGDNAVESLPKSKKLDPNAVAGVSAILEGMSSETPEESFSGRCKQCGKKLDNDDVGLCDVCRKQKKAAESVEVTEGNIKDWIAGKINGALISLGVPQERWDAIEDAVFATALAGELGDGKPSGDTASSIADMVTELAAIEAAPMPDVAEPGDGEPVGDELGLDTDLEIADEPEVVDEPLELDEPAEEEPGVIDEPLELDEPAEEEPEVIDEPEHEAPTDEPLDDTPAPVAVLGELPAFDSEMDLDDIEGMISQLAGEGVTEEQEDEDEYALSKFMRDNATRKPNSFGTIKAVSEEELGSLLQGVESYDDIEAFGKYINPDDSPTLNDFTGAMPDNFILKTGFGTFLVTTGGTSYVRYAVKISESKVEGAQYYLEPPNKRLKKNKGKCESKYLPGQVVTIVTTEGLQEAEVVDVHAHNKTLSVDIDGELLTCSFSSIAKMDIDESLYQEMLEGKDITEVLDMIVQKEYTD